MTINKYHVQLLWKTQDGLAMAPIYAESPQQAAEIAMARHKDRRKDYDAMLELKANVTLCTDSKDESTRPGVGQ